jgi:subtilisin family serine protease
MVMTTAVVYVSQNKRKVINMSLGGGANAALDAAVNNAVAAGVLVVVAAGNSNANACNASPARAASGETRGSHVVGSGVCRACRGASGCDFVGVFRVL